MQIPPLNETEPCYGTPLGLLSLQTEAWKWPEHTLAALTQQNFATQPTLSDGVHFIAKQLNNQMRRPYRCIVNSRTHAAERYVKIFCMPTVFKRTIWSGLFEREKAHKPNKRRTTYRANLKTMKRLAVLIKRENLSRSNPDGSKVFVAPKAFCLCDWYDPALQTPQTAALNLRKGEFVAVLFEIRESNLCFCWQMDNAPESTVEILGQQVQGKLGMCPVSVLRFISPTTIFYSPCSMTLTIAVAFFPFTEYGAFCGCKANVMFLRRESKNENAIV